MLTEAEADVHTLGPAVSTVPAPPHGTISPSQGLLSLAQFQVRKLREVTELMDLAGPPTAWVGAADGPALRCDWWLAGLLPRQPGL